MQPTDTNGPLVQYLYIRHSNLYILALTKRNTNATEILLFLHKLVEVFTEYFKVLEEESIRDNFVIIYELLDEMMDFGYPQTTESKILQEYASRVLFFDLGLGDRVADRPAFPQIHHPRITQAGGAGTAANRCYECSFLAKRRHSLPQERGVPRCGGVFESVGLGKRKRAPV